MPASLTLDDRQALLKIAIELAERAGRDILTVVQSGRLGTRTKADQSPVTEADLRSNEILLKGLGRASSDPIVSEESLDLVPKEIPWGRTRFWLIDPLDGTRDFIAGKKSYVVNVALIEGGRPVLGVVHAPALRDTYWATAGGGAFKNGARIANARSEQRDLIAYASGAPPTERSLDFMRRNAVAAVRPMGSAIKFCLVAEGLGDLYPRFGPTYEWDTAAGHAVLDEAGCRLLAIDSGEPLAYGKTDFLNGGFMALRADLGWANGAITKRHGARGAP